jgi:hypothetical protein
MTESLRALSAEVAAASSTYGDLGIAVPAAAAPRSADPAEWEHAAGALTAALAACQNRLAQAVGAARTQHLIAAAGSLTASLKEDVAPRRDTPKQTEAPRVEALSRVISRMPSDAEPEALRRCEDLVGAWHRAPGNLQQDQILSAVRLLVQREQDAAHARESNRTRINELYQELDGLGGREVETVRGLLRGLGAAAELPGDIAERVARARDAARAERDRAFVLAVAAQTLKDLGYALADDFVTAVPGDGALVNLPHSPAHGLRVRERDHQLMLNVVRFGEPAQGDPLADVEAETLFCHDFLALRSNFGKVGVNLDMLRADPPGATPMQVVRERPSQAASQQRAAPARERTREA